MLSLKTYFDIAAGLSCWKVSSRDNIKLFDYQNNCNRGIGIAKN